MEGLNALTVFTLPNNSVLIREVSFDESVLYIERALCNRINCIMSHIYNGILN